MDLHALKTNQVQIYTENAEIRPVICIKKLKYTKNITKYY